MIEAERIEVADRYHSAAPQDSSNARPRWSRALLAILLLATLVRLPSLIQHPFLQDELYTLEEATDLFRTRLEPGINARPLYFLLQHVLLRVVPPTEVGLRAPALLFGLLGVWATWLVARRLFGARAAVVAGFIIAVHPWHIWISTLARYWSLVYLLAVLGFFWFIRAHTTRKRGDYVKAAVLFALGTLTHPTFLIGIAGITLGAKLISNDGKRRWQWPSRDGWIYLWLPFVLLLVGEWLVLWLTGNESTVRNLEGRGLGATVRLVPTVVFWVTPVTSILGVTAAVLLAVGKHVAEVRRWGAMTLVGGTVLVLALLAASMRSDVYFTYAVYVLPLIVISIAGLVHIGAEQLLAHRRVFTVVATIAVTAGLLPYMLSQLTDGSRWEYRPALRTIASVAPEIRVLTWPTNIATHYAPNLGYAYLSPDTTYLDSTLADQKRFWAVASVKREGIATDEGGVLAAWLHRNCRVASSTRKQRFDYQTYRVDLYRCGPGALWQRALARP